MNRCPNCGYRFETAADLEAHAPCPEVPHRSHSDRLPRVNPRPTKALLAALNGEDLQAGMTPRQKLVEHLSEHHKRIKPGRRSMADLQKDHGREHHRHSPNHRHEGRNSGPDDRPVGWKTGEGVVTKAQDRAIFLAKINGGRKA